MSQWEILYRDDVDDFSRLFGGSIHITSNYLNMAVGRNRHRILKYILDSGGLVPDDILSTAVSSNYRTVEILLACPRVKVQPDIAIVFASVKKPKWDIIHMLVSDKRVNIHANNDQLIVTAVTNDQLNLVVYLLNVGVKFNANNNSGIVAAVRNNHFHIFQAFLDRYEYTHGHNFDNVFEQIILRNSMSMMLYLLQRKIVVNFDYSRMFALACYNSRLMIAAELLKLCTRDEDFDALCTQILLVAIRRSNYQICTLVAHQIYLNNSEEHLYEAMMRHDKNVIDALLIYYTVLSPRLCACAAELNIVSVIMNRHFTMPSEQFAKLQRYDTATMIRYYQRLQYRLLFEIYFGTSMPLLLVYTLFTNTIDVPDEMRLSMWHCWEVLKMYKLIQPDNASDVISEFNLYMRVCKAPKRYFKW